MAALSLGMILSNAKLMVVGGYMLTVAAAAVASGVTSGAGLIIFTAIAVLPSGALLTMWTDPEETLPEPIPPSRR